MNHETPILLGKKDTPLDLTELHKRSMERLGRNIHIGELLTNPELHKLGFTLAANNKGLYYPSERKKYLAGIDAYRGR